MKNSEDDYSHVPKQREELEQVLHKLEIQLEELDEMFKTAENNKATTALYTDNNEWISLEERELNLLRNRDSKKEERNEDYSKETKRLFSQPMYNTDHRYRKS